MSTWRDVKIVRHRDLRVRRPGLTRQRVLCHSYSIWNALVVKSAAQKVVQRAQADVSTITQGKGQPVPAAVLKHKRQQCSTYKLWHSAATTGSQQAGTKVQQVVTLTNFKLPHGKQIMMEGKSNSNSSKEEEQTNRGLAYPGSATTQLEFVARKSARAFFGMWSAKYHPLRPLTKSAWGRPRVHVGHMDNMMEDECQWERRGPGGTLMVQQRTHSQALRRPQHLPYHLSLHFTR